MWLQAMRKQLVRDLKASWQKSALLGLLLLVGLWFWIPPLLRTVVGNGTEPAPASKPRVPAAVSEAESRRPSEPAEDAPLVYSWENVDELLERDPLVQSAEVADRHRDPFGVDPDQFPPPIAFAEEPKSSASWPAGADHPAPLAASDELQLKSTIVGEHRRAALINRKLYLEGSAIEVSGKTYVLAAVHPRKVLLQCGDETLELTMPTPYLEAESDDSATESPTETR